jgi:hypothetical protein
MNEVEQPSNWLLKNPITGIESAVHAPRAAMIPPHRRAARSERAGV